MYDVSNNIEAHYDKKRFDDIFLHSLKNFIITMISTHTKYTLYFQKIVDVILKSCKKFFCIKIIILIFTFLYIFIPFIIIIVMLAIPITDLME